eukprot:8021430-Pyramimonas_sp.AAC.1
MGMRTETKQQKATIVRLAGAERLDMVVRYRDCPEEEGVHSTVMLGELEIKLNKTQRGSHTSWSACATSQTCAGSGRGTGRAGSTCMRRVTLIIGTS